MERKFIGMTPRIATMRRDIRGYPIPYFVQYIDGEPDFRVMNTDHMEQCIKHDKCWICGGKLGRHKVFVIGPMCCINRVSSEPPMHYDCAMFSVQNCPFLTKPLATRGRRKVMPKGVVSAGLMIEHNPGVTCVWHTKGYNVFSDGMGGILFNIGEPVKFKFYAEGREATREEITAAMEKGLPILRKVAMTELGGIRVLGQKERVFNKLLSEQYP